MFGLASLLYSIVGTSLAGGLIVVVLVAGMGTAPYIVGAAALGAAAAMPVAWLVARAITARADRVRG